MELRMFRTLWGASGDIDTIADEAVADLREINGWMADTERLHFSLWAEAQALRPA